MPTSHDAANDSTGGTGSLPLDGERLADRVEPGTVRTVVKLLLGGTAVVCLLALVSLLPGVDRVVPETPVTLFALAVAVFTVVLVGTLVALARPVEELVYQATAGPERVRLLTAVIAKHLVVLAAVVVAHAGFAGVMVPFFAVSGAVWLYDVGFLVLAAVPTAFVAYYAYRALDPSAAYLTERLLGTGDAAAATAPGDGGDGAHDAAADPTRGDDG